MSLNSFGSPSSKIAPSPPPPPDETLLFRLSRSSFGRAEVMSPTQSYVDTFVQGALQESTGLRGAANLLFAAGVFNRASRLISLGRVSMAAAETAPVLESWLVMRSSSVASRLTEWGTQLFRNSRWAFPSAVLPIVGSLFLTTGCGSQKESPKATASQTASSPPPPDPWDLKSEGNRKVRIDLEGDPQLGKLLFIRQHTMLTK